MLPGPAPLFKAGPAIAIVILISWLMSVVLEWPFCYWPLRGQPDLWRRTLKATLISQTVSYAIIVPLYLLVASISMITGTRIERTLSFVKPPIATVFYIDNHDHSVWSVRTDGTGRARVSEVIVRDPDARVVAKVDVKARRSDLYVAVPSSSKSDDLRVATRIAVVRGLASVWKLENQEFPRSTYSNFGSSADLRQSHHDLGVYSSFWADDGLSVYKAIGENSGYAPPVYFLGFDTPLAHWFCRNATVMPGDLVVFQLGIDDDSQVVVLDLHTRQLGFLAMGHGPVVMG